MEPVAHRTHLRALVVDDEANLRRLISRALMAEGFICDMAENGEVAWKRIQESSFRYDLVVTDLSMPTRNGHALTVDLLTLPDRPLISVLTGMVEPRLAKDLIARGADDVVFKPIQFAAFAAKMRALVDRRAIKQSVKKVSSVREPAAVTAQEFAKNVHELSRIPSVSQASIEVFKLTSAAEADIAQVAASVKCNPSLTAEVLRVANSSFFNPSNKKIWEVDQAVARLGMKRVGELALGSAAFAAITQEAIPFFDIARTWRRALASGLCLEMLLNQNRNTVNPSGLFSSTLFLPMARLMLATTHPDAYRSMLKHCLSTQQSLSDQEERVFPQTIGDAVAAILTSWDLPEEIWRPLRHAFSLFSDLTSLSEPLRFRVELVKLAGFLGDLAVGEFEPFDRIDLPSAALLKRLNVHSIDTILRQCVDDLGQIPMPKSTAAPAEKTGKTDKPTQCRLLAYKRLNNTAVDLIPFVLNTADVRLIEAASEICDVEDAVLINAFDAAIHQLAARVRIDTPYERVVLTSPDAVERMSAYGQAIAFPCSYSALVSVCTAIAKPTPPSESRVAAAAPSNADASV